LAGIILVMVAGFGWLYYRLFEIQIARHGELQAKARQFTETTRIIEACRGKILDRNGRVLANSVPAKIIYANLTLCSNRVEQIAQTCGPLLGIPPGELANRLRNSMQRPANRGTGPAKALVLKRNVAVAEWQALSSALALESFGFRKPLLAPAEKAELQKLLAHSLTPPAATGLVRPRRQGGSVVPQRARGRSDCGAGDSVRGPG